MADKRIFVIDDEIETRNNLVHALSKFGFSCTAYDSGIVAIQELLESSQKGIGYHCFIIDPFLPDVDGWNLGKLFQKKYPDVPILFIPKFKNICLLKSPSYKATTGCMEKPLDFDLVARTLLEWNLQETTIKKTEHATTSDTDFISYVLIQISAPEQSKEIYEELSSIENIVSCEAVRGDLQIVLLIKTATKEKMKESLEKIEALQGIHIVSVLPVEKLSFGLALESFLQEYQQMLQEEEKQKETNKSYLLLDIEPALAKNIYVTLFFTDRVISCDCLNKGEKLIVKIYKSDTAKKDKILEKLKQMEGVLRLRQENIIELRSAQ